MVYLDLNWEHRRCLSRGGTYLAWLIDGTLLNIYIPVLCVSIECQEANVKSMSLSLSHSLIPGHNGPVTCIIVPPKSPYLITGSEDTTVIVWDTRNLTIKQRIR